MLGCMANDANSPARTLERVIGENVKRLRGPRLQDDLVLEVRRHGMVWTQSTISAIERGERRIDVAEFVWLCLILKAAPDELLAGDEDEVALAGPNPGLPLQDVRDALGGTERFRGVDTRHQERLEQKDVMIAGVTARLHAAEEDLQTQASREAERKAARRLGVDPITVARTAASLWGRSLTEERDAQVGETTPPGASRRSVQAYRGRVTRELMSALWDQIEKDRLIQATFADELEKMTSEHKDSKEN
jgi:transcriptional regulator with XRE-family HTH domain